MPRVAIVLHPSYHVEIRRFCVEAEAAGCPFDFEHLRPDRKLMAPFEVEELDAAEGCRRLAELRAPLGLSDQDVLVLLTRANLFDRHDDEYFLRTSMDDPWPPELGGPVGLISLYFLQPSSDFMTRIGREWSGWSEEKRKNVESQLITVLLFATVACLICDLEFHDRTDGCAMDYCQETSEILETMRRSRLLCRECQALLAKTPEGKALRKLADRVWEQVRPPSLFLSYAKPDEERVEVIYDRLSGAGLRPWMAPRDILPGLNWPREIERALKEAQFFLACISPNSVYRRGYVQSELKTAMDLYRQQLGDDIYLIPVLLEECEPPDELEELQLQRVHLFEPDGWPRLELAIEEGIRRRLTRR